MKILSLEKVSCCFIKKPFLLPTSGLMWFIIFKCTGKECDYSCVLRNELRAFQLLERWQRLESQPSLWMLLASQCIMHLEDRLQEMYLKSKMLSEYLRGHTRVHVKELGVVLGWVLWSATVSPVIGLTLALHPLTDPLSLSHLEPVVLVPHWNVWGSWDLCLCCFPSSYLWYWGFIPANKCRVLSEW